MIASDNHQMTAGLLQVHHKTVIEFARIAWGRSGLRKSIPLVYACFLVGGAALAALPLITAGFFSKDEILAGAMANGWRCLPSCPDLRAGSAQR
jgi:NADH:ubiquinone oxidoreductase subunit 5 (subunit L)/multisubunit Na+/H+ antiporter MnhA subunit